MPMHPNRGQRDHHTMRTATGTRGRLLGVVVMASLVAGCDLLVPSEPGEAMRIAEHASYTYVWPERLPPCQTYDCGGDRFPVDIDHATSSDPDIVEVWIEYGNVLGIVTHRPGFATVHIDGEQGYEHQLDISVQAIGAIELTERRSADARAVMLPSTTAAFDVAVYDLEGESLDGAPSFALTTTAGAFAEMRGRCLRGRSDRTGYDGIVHGRARRTRHDAHRRRRRRGRHRRPHFGYALRRTDGR